MRLFGAVLVASLAGIFSVLIAPSTALATNSLKVQPLLYTDSLARGEIKKGFVDVSNPTASELAVETSVQAFRQVDDQGNIAFFQSKDVEEGITPDFEEFTLGPREAMRIYFEIDGNKLPSGDIFAVLFMKATPQSEGMIDQSVRIGTLLILENGTPGARDASITQLETSFLQTGSTLEGSYRIKNDAQEGEATGFMSKVTVALSPLGPSFDHQASLVFAGRERQNDFELETNRVGFYKLSVMHGDSTESRWVFLLPLWAVYVLIGITAVSVLLRTLHTRKKRVYKRS